MKKHLLTLMLVILCVVAFALSASAQEYIVSSNDQYEVAYNNAESGDTIIVDSKLTCDIYANKSITYILKADWESSKLVVDTSNVEVSFIADGGNYKIMPTNYSTTDGWMNIAEIYENVVINLGGMNGGTLTIDGTNATHDRVSYVTMVEKVQYDIGVFPDICLNLLSGSAIANFNPTTKDDNVNACLLYAKTVNMYDGCQIYGNNVISAPLFKSCYFNMYGGEIFGNLLTSTRFEKNGVGFIYADRQFVMYDGKISKNIFKAIHSTNYSFNVAGFITTNQKYYGSKGTVVLGGEVGDRYVSGTGNNEISAVFGVYVKDNGQTPFYYNTGITAGTRYKFTDTPQFTLDQETGKTIWKVSTFSTNTSDISANNYGFCWNSTKKSGDKVAVFLNAQKKPIAGNNFDTYTVINAYIEGVYSNSGSNTISIPSGYTLWSTDGNKYCHTGKTYTLDEVKASSSVVFYTAYDAERVTVDGTTMCSGCYLAYSCSNPNHDLEIVSISYDSSYTESGEKVLKCNTCGLEKSATVSAQPLFTCNGYSVPENNRIAITVSYAVNKNAVNEYKSVNDSFEYGVFGVLADRIGTNELFKEDGSLTTKSICADLTDKAIVSVTLKIVGFTTEADKALSLAMGIYTKETVEEQSKYTYVQASNPEEGQKYSVISYNEIPQ